MTRHKHPAYGTDLPPATDQPIDRFLVHLAVTHECTPHIAELVRRVERAHRVGRARRDWDLEPYMVVGTGPLGASSRFYPTSGEAYRAQGYFRAHSWTDVNVIDLGALANTLGLRIIDGRVQP